MEKKVIEIVGFPGSGKSTLLKSLEDDDTKIVLEEDFYHYAETIQKSRFFTTVKSLFKNRKFFFYLLFYAVFVCRPIRYSLKKYFEMIRYVVIYDSLIKSSFKENTIIFDQGIIQYIWSFSFEDDENKMKEGLILSLIMKELVRKHSHNKFIYYNIDSDVAARRAILRDGHSPMDKKERKYLEKLYKLHECDYKIIFTYLPKENKEIIKSQVDFFNIIKEDS